jgi:hypothetical protein
MKFLCSLFTLATVSALSAVALAQTPRPATDVYHVMFVKALPGQAAALAKDLQQQDPKDPMAGHVLLLRHVEGGDWDYCIIQHLGTRTTVEITPAPSNTATPLRAWHDDTFVAGPPWAEFERAMGLTAGQAGNAVHVVGVHRAAPGHRDQLLEVLNRPDPASKIQVGHVTLAHLEGGPWQFVSIDRYNSWQDFAADRSANPSGGSGWLEVRQHSEFHNDTITERVR